jgi:hypothetical protein
MKQICRLFKLTHSNGYLDALSYNFSSPSWLNTGATASFSGNENNFLFSNSTTSPTAYFDNIGNWYGNGQITNILLPSFSAPYSEGYGYPNSIVANAWSVTAVPEPEEWAMLLLG